MLIPPPSYTQYLIALNHVLCCLFSSLVSLAEGTELYLYFYPQMQDVGAISVSDPDERIKNDSPLYYTL